jgi:Flp pilus assembly protein TadG
MVRNRSEAGAAAVEFALILPLLLLILAGIIDLGLLLNAAMTAGDQAREAARSLALAYDPLTQTGKTDEAAALAEVGAPSGCAPGTTVHCAAFTVCSADVTTATVVVRTPVSYAMSGLIPGLPTVVTGKASVPCPR